MTDTLAEAIRGNNMEAATAALAEPDVRARLNDAMPGGAFGAAALHEAVNRRQRDMIDVLLRAGADINQKTHWEPGGFHVLEFADPELVPFLMERGAVVNIQAAARLGRLDDVERLLREDPAAATSRSGDGQTALHRAATVEIARVLLEHGAELDARDVDHESTPAQYLVREHPEVARFLLSRGAASDILMAAALGDLARVQAFVREDPGSVRVTVSGKYFPMLGPGCGGTIYIWTLGKNKGPHVLAREFGHEDVLAFLLDHTPNGLRLATLCELGDERGVREMLAAHPDLVASLTDAEQRRLPAAAEYNNLAGVRLMLEAGWPVGATVDNGATALHWAAFNGNLEIVRELFARGASVTARDTQFDGTPLGWCEHGVRFGPKSPGTDHAGVAAALASAL